MKLFNMYHFPKYALLKISSVDALSRSSKALPKATLPCKKKMPWSLFGGLLPELINYSFLNSRETIASEKCARQINEMHWKLQGLQPALVHRKGPVLLHDSAPPHITQLTLQKLNELGYAIFTSNIHLTSCQLTTTFSSILATFCWENASSTRRMQKVLSKSSSYPEAWIFFFLL